MVPFDGARTLMHILAKTLIAASIILFMLSGISLLLGIYPWVGKLDPTDIRIYKIGNKFLWAIIFALAMERACLFNLGRGPKVAVTLLLAFFSVSGIAEAIIQMAAYARSTVG